MHLSRIFHSQGFVVFFEFVINIFQVAIDLLLVEVVLITVLSPELSAINRKQFTTDQIKILRYAYRFPKHVFDGFRIIAAEVGNGIVVRF